MQSFTRSQIAYVDEYGDPNLETSKEGATTYYIITAVLVDAKELNQVEEKCDQVRKRYFQTGEMKSSSVGNDDPRRIKILTSLCEINARFYSIAIDKRKILEDGGLIYKRPFLKFLNGLLYRKLYRTFPQIRVLADEIGSSEFMQGFERYVKKRHIPDLFRHAEFGFADSKSEPILQAADFISGSLARIFDPKKVSGIGDEIMALLDRIAIAVDEWPPKMRFLRTMTAREDKSEFDAAVREQGLIQAHIFREENHGTKDEAISLQLEVVEYLLYHFKFLNAYGYVPTSRLLSVLGPGSSFPLTEHNFRSRVIAPLRDSGVIIASSSKGYKIPSCVSDVSDFIDHYYGMIHPMVDRIRKTRDQLLLATKNNFDIIDNEKYEYVRRLLIDE